MDCEKLKRRHNCLKGRINCLCQNLDASIREPGSRVDIMMTLDSISELLERCQEAQDAVEAVITDDEEQKKEIQKNEEVQLEFDICQTSGLEHSELYRQSPRFPSFWEQFNTGIRYNAELADVTKFICDEILIGRPNGDKTLRELHDELVTHVKSLRALNRDTSERLHHGSHKFSRQDEMEMKKKECRRSNKVLSANVATGNLCSICRKNHQVEGCPLSLKLRKMVPRMEMVHSDGKEHWDDIEQCERAGKRCSDGREGRTWHLPHRAVFKMDKTTSKCRIIFDGSHRCEGVSLNERLDPGSPIIVDLVGILLRFRQFKIGIHADITKMFLQIELHPEDRDVTRFVWRKQGEEMPCIYRFCRLFFGLCCSPYLATIAVQYLAVNHETEYQETVNEGSVDEHMVITVCYASKNLAAAILATGELTGTRLFPFLKNQCGDVEGTGER
ncbi:hypothetical protein T06_10734 [Trichinella sp. T6]|nr:hypothetical protein T06_10734 [Trichinella sp. T6]